MDFNGPVSDAILALGRRAYDEGTGVVPKVLPEVLGLLNEEEEQKVRDLYAQGYFDRASEAVRAASKPLLRYVGGRLT